MFDLTLGQSILAGAGAIVAGLLIKDLVFLVARRRRAVETLKYEFITIIAHKFRTPLTQLKWLSEARLADEQDAYKRESLTETKKVTQHLIDLTNTLIELTDSDDASRASYTIERLNLCELVRAVADSYKQTFHEKNIFLVVQCAVNEIWINADRARMEFVLQVMLENAVTYTPPGRNVEVSVVAEGRRAAVAVIDHGIGIDAADLPRVFTKFFRAANAQTVDTEGFGVSLYLANAIVRRHRGTMKAYSEGLNKGSAFSVIVPAVK